MNYSEYRRIENQHAAYCKVQTSVSHILTTILIMHHTGWSIPLNDRLEDFEDPQGGTEELADLMGLKILFLRSTTWLIKREIIKMQNLKHRLLAE